MPRLSSGTYRPKLTALALEYIENQVDFVGLKVLPTFEVDEKRGEFPLIPVEALLEMPENITRRPRGKYTRSDYEFEMDTYDCVENGFEEPVDAVEAKMYASLFDAEEIAMLRALGIVLRKQEKRISDMLFNESNFDVNSIENEWDDSANAVPINDVETGLLTVLEAIGVMPDTLIITLRTFLNLKKCDQIIDQVKYTSPELGKGQLSAATIAAVLGVAEIQIAGGMYNASNKGMPASLSPIWSNDYAMLCVTSDSKDLKVPAIGRTFRWTDDSAENATVEHYEEEDVRSTVIRVRQHTDEEILHAEAAYLLGNLVTPSEE